MGAISSGNSAGSIGVSSAFLTGHSIGRVSGRPAYESDLDMRVHVFPRILPSPIGAHSAIRVGTECRFGDTRARDSFLLPPGRVASLLLGSGHVTSRQSSRTQCLARRQEQQGGGRRRAHVQGSSPDVRTQLGPQSEAPRGEALPWIRM